MTRWLYNGGYRASRLFDSSSCHGEAAGLVETGLTQCLSVEFQLDLLTILLS